MELYDDQGDSFVYEWSVLFFIDSSIFIIIIINIINTIIINFIILGLRKSFQNYKL